MRQVKKQVKVRQIKRSARACLMGVFLALSAWWPSTANAQIPQVYSQYFINPYVYNPALAGAEGHHAIFLMYRYQWLGINDAPQVGYLNWHAPIRTNLNLGAMFTNDRVGPLVNNSFMATGSYLLNLDGTHFFRLGLSLGVGLNSLDFGTLIDEGPLGERLSADIENVSERNTHLLANFGLMYHFGRFNIGASLPNLIARDVLSENDFQSVSVSPLDNAFFKVNYRHSLFSDNLAIEPHVLYRFSQIGKNQAEGTLIFHIKHLVWVGASYRQDAGIIGLFGFKVAEKVGFGYAYDLTTTTDIEDYSSGTHEVHIGLHLGTRREHAKHVSSFIKSHGKTKDERDAEQDAELERLLAEQEAVEKAQEAADAPALPEVDIAPPPTALSGVEAARLVISDPVAQQGWSQHSGTPSKERPYIQGEITGDGIEYVHLQYVDPQGNTSFIAAPLPTNRHLKGEKWTLVAVGEQTRVNAQGQQERLLTWRIESPDGSVETRNIWAPVYGSVEAMRAALQALGARQLSEEEALAYYALQATPGAYAPPTPASPVVTTPPPATTPPRSTLPQQPVSTDLLKNSLVGAVARKGNHEYELPIASYVIVGSFRVYNNAVNYSKYLLEKGQVTHVGYNSERGYYYIDVYSSPNVLEARSQRDHLRESALFSDAWVLTVIEGELEGR